MEKKITVYVKEPGKTPQKMMINNTLEALQGLVGGYIETVPAPYPGCLFIVNEEGRLRNLVPNICIGRELLVGTAVLVGVKGEDFCSVPDSVKWEV